MRYRMGRMATEQNDRRKGKRNRNTGASRSIHVRLTDEQYEAVNRIAVAGRVAQAEVVRQAVTERIARG
jgi:hypothetical protein